MRLEKVAPISKITIEVFEWPGGNFTYEITGPEREAGTATKDIRGILETVMIYVSDFLRSVRKK